MLYRSQPNFVLNERLDSALSDETVDDYIRPPTAHRGKGNNYRLNFDGK